MYCNDWHSQHSQSPLCGLVLTQPQIVFSNIKSHSLTFKCYLYIYLLCNFNLYVQYTIKQNYRVNKLT